MRIRQRLLIDRQPERVNKAAGVSGGTRKPGNSRFLVVAVGLVLSGLMMLTLVRGDDPAPKNATKRGIVDDKRINEASGLAISRCHPECVWMHNDSGDKPRLFLVDATRSPDEKCRTRAIVELADETAHDWEDMCSFEWNGSTWLLIADIGDNPRSRGTGNLPVCRLLFVREQPIPGATDVGDARRRSEPLTVKWDVHSRVEFSWEDGPRDCESIGVDTQRNEILLVSKTQPLDCGLYAIPLRVETGKQFARAERIATIGIPYATSMDVSSTNDRIVIVNPLSGIVLARQPQESWSEACQHPPESLELPKMRQCETVCFDRSGDAVFVTSEFENPSLWSLSLRAGKNSSLP